MQAVDKEVAGAENEIFGMGEDTVALICFGPFKFASAFFVAVSIGTVWSLFVDLSSEYFCT